MKKKGTKKNDNQVREFRQCVNIKSKKHPDIQCPFAATQGEFCTRHSKNPRRMHLIKVDSADISLESLGQAEYVKKLQRWWRWRIGLRRFMAQGPATNAPDTAENETDLFTLDDVKYIPTIYRWSYCDTRKHIWLFDIRSILMTISEENDGQLLNPYTREYVGEKAETHFHSRWSWLRGRKYCLVHVMEQEMTPEQLWHQKILDTIMKYDMLGYHTAIHWFEELNIRQLWYFYNELWELWYYRMQLSPQVKEQVVPGWSNPNTLLFKWNPQSLLFRNERRWWQNTIIELMDRLVSSSRVKENRVLGALYGITAFAIVSPRVRMFYPWLVEVEGE